MPRWMVFAPLIGVVAAGIVLAILLGGRAVTTTETEVIERVAALYVSDAVPAAKRTDCAARPAESDRLWLVISCARPSGAGTEFFVDRFGQVVDRSAIGSEG